MWQAGSSAGAAAPSPTGSGEEIGTGGREEERGRRRVVDGRVDGKGRWERQRAAAAPYLVSQAR